MGKIKNLSLRKTIVLYMIISLIISFYLSALIMRIASTVQNNIWWNYVDQEEYFEMAEGDGRRYLPDVPRPHSYEMKEFDYHVSEICDFLQTFTVLIVSVAGSIIAVFLFYKHNTYLDFLTLQNLYKIFIVNIYNNNFLYFVNQNELKG